VWSGPAVKNEIHDSWLRLIISPLSLFLKIVQFALALIYLGICGRTLAGSFIEETMQSGLCKGYINFIQNIY